MEHVLLSMQHISKSYPGVQALDDVSLRLDRGQILALAGENGAGKSTLMKILSGSVTPSGGTILLDGEEVSFSNPRQALDASGAELSQRSEHCGKHLCRPSAAERPAE